jgi:hypothetical protein
VSRSPSQRSVTVSVTPRRDTPAEPLPIREKGFIVSNIELPVLREHAIGGKKRLRRVVPFFTAAALSASLIVTLAGPASAAVRTSAAPMISVSGDGRPAVALRAALDHVRLTGDGRFALASVLGKRARSADSALVADLNSVERQSRSLGLGGGSIAGAAAAVRAAVHGTIVVTILPGITLTISGTTVVLYISPQDVTVIENVLGFGATIAALVGDILALAQVPYGPAITGIVASSLTAGSDALKLCAGIDGGSVILSVSVPADRLPVVSACGITV